MRGRPKSFDREQVLEKALTLFWQRGYGATGLGELTEHMGIGRQSLYNAFGDKHSLYLEALRSYTEQRYKHVRGILEAEGSPMDNLRRFLAELRSEALDSCCGCMMVNSSTEIGDVDEAAARILESSQARFEQLFSEHLERAKQAGELTSAASPQTLARFVANTLNGLAVTSRLGMSEKELDDVLYTLLLFLTPTAA